MLVALTLVAATEDSRHRRRAAMALGAALGLAFLQRYDLLALTPIAILLLLARSTTAARTPLAMWCTAGLTATAGLWIARNLVVVGTVLGSTSVDRNLLGGVVAGDVYMATRTVSAWSYVLENLPAFLVKFDVARIWFVQHAATLFGGLLAMASAAVALALPVLERSRAARTAWMFLVGGFVARALRGGVVAADRDGGRAARACDLDGEHVAFADVVRQPRALDVQLTGRLHFEDGGGVAEVVDDGALGRGHGFSVTQRWGRRPSRAASAADV